MGVELGIASLVIGAYTAVKADSQSKKAAEAQKDAARAQQASSAEQQANQLMQREQERRQQVRENRIRVAQVMQNSANTGTSSSSGELGAVSSLNTQTSSNLGFISGAEMHTNAASMYNQQASDLWFRATEYQNRARRTQQFGNFVQGALETGYKLYNKD